MTSERSPNNHIGFYAESTFKIKPKTKSNQQEKIEQFRKFETKSRSKNIRNFEILKPIHDLQRAKHLLI